MHKVKSSTSLLIFKSYMTIFGEQTSLVPLSSTYKRPLLSTSKVITDCSVSHSPIFCKIIIGLLTQSAESGVGRGRVRGNVKSNFYGDKKIGGIGGSDGLHFNKFWPGSFPKRDLFLNCCKMYFRFYFCNVLRVNFNFFKFFVNFLFSFSDCPNFSKIFQESLSAFL